MNENNTDLILSEPDQPNIIFIITDQQRADTIGTAGSDWMITPTLDKLAEDAVVFNTVIGKP